LKVKPAYLKTIIFDKENRIKALNQVVAADYKGNSIEVPVESLDYILEKLQPTLIKIDVEGFEPEVIEGSRKILTSDSVLAVLLETVDPSIEKILRESGFQPTS
jgi:FkbM family methyltransferase